MDYNEEQRLRELGYKQCVKCNQLLPAEQYYKRRPEGGGVVGTCRKCHRKAIHGYRKVKGSYEFWYKKLDRTRRSARQRGLAFTLTVEDMQDIKNETTCYYCKMETDLITMDRKDNSIGYVKENIVPCCYACNKLKSNIFDGREMKIIGVAIRLWKRRMAKLNKDAPIELNKGPSDYEIISEIAREAQEEATKRLREQEKSPTI